MTRFGLILLVAFVSACSSNSYCLIDQPYQTAQVVPELKPVDELRLPSTASSLRLPPGPEKPIPFGRENEEGDGICLDKPPRLVIKQTEAGESGSS